MAGLLVHLLVGIICAGVVFKFFKKKEYSLAWFSFERGLVTQLFWILLGKLHHILFILPRPC
jgi:hypothetical protein